MKRYTPEELAEVLRLHKLWLENKEGGVRAVLSGAVLRGSILRDAVLRGADLSGALLSGADLSAKTFRIYSGLYEYDCWAIVTEDGTPWVRMGCLWKSVPEWDEIGICKSNLREYPDDGSEKSERRVRAFEYVRGEALRMAALTEAQGLLANERRLRDVQGVPV